MSTTETISSRYVGLDSWSDKAILDAFSEGQERAVAAVRASHPAIIQAARAMVARLGAHGRIIYLGAGSSGTIAAIDGMELPGTFGWPDERVVFLLAGGDRIAPLAGGGEDDAVRARADMARLDPGVADVAIAIAASGTTPFTIAAVGAARARGALTIGIANNGDTPLLKTVELPILLDSGPEVIVGSTRMGAGTAQKAALGLLSNLVMIRMGHIYDGFMVNLRVDNAKLRERAIRTLRHIAGCSQEGAAAALDRCNGNVKSAALVLRGVAPAEADRILSAAGGNLRVAFARLN